MYTGILSSRIVNRLHGRSRGLNETHRSSAMTKVTQWSSKGVVTWLDFTVPLGA